MELRDVIKDIKYELSFSGIESAEITFGISQGRVLSKNGPETVPGIVIDSESVSTVKFMLVI